MHDFVDDLTERYSHGMRQRTVFASALVHEPKVLIVDEPTVGLDIGSRQGILDHVRRLCAEEGLGVLWATHLIDEVHADDQVIVLHLGRIRALGDGAAICAKAEAPDLRHAFTKLTAEARAA